MGGFSENSVRPPATFPIYTEEDANEFINKYEKYLEDTKKKLKPLVTNKTTGDVMRCYNEWIKNVMLIAPWLMLLFFVVWIIRAIIVFNPSFDYYVGALLGAVTLLSSLMSYHIYTINSKISAFNDIISHEINLEMHKTALRKAPREFDGGYDRLDPFKRELNQLKAELMNIHILLAKVDKLL